ncbi:PD40 domain-containing protein [Streptomyces sp. FH025]|uniref:TolB family protein n=1 Tax=Streptomyces sp. FH025 TaxID=2815937 RepID=UPI001A9F2231|nr:PD40 domain-containing protein [Streptomyces sp. FH025]MBO1419254.1 PD40 domain-containing protein [Streptomyces sp. FH025]
MTRSTGTRQSPRNKARTRATAGAGLLLLGTLLTGCGAEPGDIPLSEIRPDSPTATPSAAAGVVGAVAGSPAAAAHDGLIVSRAYTDASRSTSAIVTLSPDGTGQHQVTQPSDRTLDDRPDWSPDGTTIAFDRTDPRSGTARLWAVSATGDNAHQISQLCDTSAATADCANEDERAPAFSPDGKQLAFSRSWGTLDTGGAMQTQYSDLYLMSPDGTDVQRLTFLTNDKPYSGTVSNPSWSPDGKQLTFEYRTGATGQPANSRAIYVVGVDGTGLRQLTPWELRAGDRASWSPDGTQILFTTYPAGRDNAPGGGIYTVHPDGTAIGALTPAPSDATYGTAAYAPDGKSVVFAQAPAGADADLYTMRPDGTGVARLTNSPAQGLSRPAWGTADVPAAQAQAPQTARPEATASASASASSPASAEATPTEALGEPEIEDDELDDN